VHNIKKIKIVSILIFAVPIVVLNVCLFISVNYQLFENTIFVVDQIGRSSFTIPYIDGGISISRSARTFPSYLIFKPGMIITAVLLIQYWLANNKLFKEISKNNYRKYFVFFGVGSALFLLLHSIFLGINFEMDLYKLFRRVILLAFIIFEVVAQAFLVLSFIKIKKEIESFINKNILTLKIILVSILIIVAFLSAPILNSSEYTHFKHALEWNYFLGVVTFYLLTFMFWRSDKPPVHTPEGV